jgi:uncharacterized membrane protein
MKTIITITLLITNLLFSHTDGLMGEHMMHSSSFPFITISGIIIIVIALPFIMRSISKQLTAKDILKKRLASGEITIDEFSSLKHTIKE